MEQFRFLLYGSVIKFGALLLFGICWDCLALVSTSWLIQIATVKCHAVPWFGSYLLSVLFLFRHASLLPILPYPHGELGLVTSLHTPLAGCGARRI